MLKVSKIQRFAVLFPFA